MANKAEIKKQVEYYLSDKNLIQDNFFYDKIKANAEGWLEIALILNCNKVKQMKVKESDIAASVEGSTQVELSEDKKKVRRANNAPLPEKSQQKKRDAKANNKEESKNKDEHKEEEDEQEIQLDERGNPILDNKDFENPIIIHFSTEIAKDEDFKVNWKEVEQTVRKQQPKLKIVYSRADPHQGELAISSFKLNEKNITELESHKFKIQNKDFQFKRLTGDELKEFWNKHGGHFQFCIQPKLRNIKKQQRMRKQEKLNEKSKRSKLSYEIAGVYYADINKVKSKARAILNLKKDGEKLTGNDEEFMKELIKFHDKGTDKMTNYQGFEVGVHPDYEKTRCFFVNKSDGKKEDFSVSKCITNLEKQQ